MSFFAKNLLFLRKKFNFTQAEMPDRIDIGRATWSNYENGVSEPDFDKLIRIAALFKVKIDDLLLVDLFANAHLNENSSTEKSSQNAHPNAHANAPDAIISLVNEEETPYNQATNKEITLLILRQLNTIAEDTKVLRQNAVK